MLEVNCFCLFKRKVNKGDGVVVLLCDVGWVCGRLSPLVNDFLFFDYGKIEKVDRGFKGTKTSISYFVSKVHNLNLLNQIDYALIRG